MEASVLNIKRPLLIAGPCSAESREVTMDTCRALALTGKVDILRAGIWKPRTMPGSYEGPGDQGLEWIADAGRELSLPVAVEVANARHVELALRAGITIYWIGARTTVSPFVVQEIADAAGRIPGANILVKNPLNPDAALWAGAVERFIRSGIAPDNVGMIHRGFSGLPHNRYRNSPLWHLAFEMRDRFPGMAFLCDPSHIAGDARLVGEVARTAADLRFDGLMVECHDNPSQALSDASQQLTPQQYSEMTDSVNWRRRSADDPDYVDKLNALRERIDQIDSDIFSLFASRMEISEQIGAIKRENNVAILQEERWRSIVGGILEKTASAGLSEEFTRHVLAAVHNESIQRQRKIMDDDQ